MATSAISDILNNDQPAPLTVEKIIEEVARTFNASTEDIKSIKRSANVSNARQIAIYICREITDLSMSAIGQQFGGRDHSTIVYAVKQVEKTTQKDKKVKAMVEDIIKNIRDR
jgi:chromosomal replication initiator protein